MRPLIPRHAAKPQQQGLSLVEVLVALLILTIGLLTMAALHASSLKLTKLNQFRTTASEVAQAFGDSVRANADGALAGGYTYSTAGGGLNAPGNTCTNAALTCTPAQIAAVDVFRARTLASALPGGDIFSALNTAAGNNAPTLSVWIYWSPPDTTTLGDQAAWASAREQCPPAIQALSPTRFCLLYTIPL